MHTADATEETLAKVPAVTAGFWVIKIAATTLGETAGDWVSMSLKLGYLLGSAIFAVLFVALVTAQVRSRDFNAWLYWPTIIATTTLGTTMADFADRSLGLGYPGGVTIISALLLASLLAWFRVEGNVSVAQVTRPRAEWFYWVTILFSQTLGTALGDWVAGEDGGGLGLGYEVGALIFGAALAVVGALAVWSRVSRTLLFWAAFILTRPLGATLGDLLDKPHAQGGFEVSRFWASAILVVVIVGCVAVLPKRAARAADGV